MKNHIRSNALTLIQSLVELEQSVRERFFPLNFYFKNFISMNSLKPPVGTQNGKSIRR